MKANKLNKSLPFKDVDPHSLPEAVQSASAILARRDHCRQELSLKLQQRGFHPETITQTLQYCEQQNWLNEAEYARIYVRVRSERGYGPLRVRQELLQKCVPSDDIEQAFNEFEGDWFELARDQRIKRFGDFWPDDFKLKLKQQNYLYRRGFDQEQIRYACTNQ
ncbi:recombination regulator RecX [Neiella marina]|uniref:Regulatory protein RecX n=1 Tax=Neiella holothuriorum TaxID=2870530 RepID=A0ABS7ECV5_9GAMM|nr:regulatory protein RecX [Neiella holothuriorum]MBW8189758.1 recombination regulator RecX [Neiella holothuriorum]